MHTMAVRTLEFYADWSAADEIADIAVDIAERTEEDEFVIASGHTWHGRDVVTAIFARFGLDAHRHIVERELEQGAAAEFRVILDKLERAIGRRPRKSVIEIAEQIVGQVRAAV
jgi:GDP-D-mannose dehydratase